MVRAEVTANGVAAVGRFRPAVTVDATDWRAGDGAGRAAEATPAIRDDVTDSAVGSATALTLPPGPASVRRSNAAEQWSPTGGESLAPGRYEVCVRSVVDVRVTFTVAGGATLTTGTEGTTIRFDATRPVRIGFAESDDEPPGTIVVPETPRGVARALSTLPANTLTTTANRSHFGMRRHPPLVEFGDETAIPEEFHDRAAESEVTLTLPPALEYLLPASSLAHYLGADVEVAEGVTPTLSTGETERQFEAMPGFQYETATLLRRVFLLDCLVREALPGNEQLVEGRLLDRLPLDPDRLADAPIGRRVDAYLDAPFDLISPDLPEWHLSMYVEPRYEYARTLPYVVPNLPNVFMPESRPLGSNERLRRSLDDFYRDTDDAPQVKPVKPLLGPGRVHGWLAEGIPIDVFKTLPEAYEHRVEGTREDRSTSVVAVLNDVEMSSEHDDAADIYRRGTAGLDVDVEVRERLTRAELADVFEADHDFVHYIGHCEEAGLRCCDGALSTDTLDRSSAETFFLNACGSYYEGFDLVSKGSVAGAVTFEKVLDGHAARVGTMFVRLLLNGFCIERALNLARRRIIMGTDYTVVGDGTHKLSGAPETVPLAVTITPEADGEAYRLTFDASSPRITGDVFRLPSPFDDDLRLFGAESETTLTPAETDRFVRRVDLPVIFDGDIQWSTDLEGQLRV